MGTCAGPLNVTGLAGVPGDQSFPGTNPDPAESLQRPLDLPASGHLALPPRQTRPVPQQPQPSIAPVKLSDPLFAPTSLPHCKYQVSTRREIGKRLEIGKRVWVNTPHGFYCGPREQTSLAFKRLV
ncbi:hypothetical protein HYQ46_004541 [Verticillium longisporum]|nr:hypothetical protein HYQ46_004541 [Verticillium longisporum]